MGLAEHTPFECVGKIEEVRIMFHIIKKKGYSGKAMSMFDTIKDKDYLSKYKEMISVNEKEEMFP